MAGSRLTSYVFLAAATMAAALCTVSTRVLEVAGNAVRRVARFVGEAIKLVAAKPAGFTWVQQLAGVSPRVLRFEHYQRRQERNELALPRLGLA